MTIDYKVIKESLNPDTHKKMRDAVGVELNKVLNKYESRVRASGKVDNVKKFAKDVKSAIAKVLAKHLTLKKPDGAINAIADSIMDGVMRDVYGVDATAIIRGEKDAYVPDFDKWRDDYLDRSKNASVQHVQQYGVTGVQQQIQDDRGEFFRKSQRDLGGAQWTPEARDKSINYSMIATTLSEGIGGRVSKAGAKRSQKHYKMAA